MANKRISELAAAGALTGAELVEAVQGGVNVQTTTQNIANLAPATPGAEAFLDLTDVPNSYSGEANKVVSVKADESGLEFTTPSAGGPTSGSGTTVAGTAVNLGGLLTENTTITGGDKELTIGTDASPLSEFDLRVEGDIQDETGSINIINRSESGAYFANAQIYSEVTSNLGYQLSEIQLNTATSGTPGNGVASVVVGAYDEDATTSRGYVRLQAENKDNDAIQLELLSVGTPVANLTGGNLTMGSNKITGLGAATANGEAVRYEQVVGVQDLYIPASAMWPRTTGGCAPLAKTEMSTSLLNIQTLDFDQTTQEFAQFTIALPRKYNNGTVTAVVYWTASSGSGDVQWGISGGAYSNDDALTVALGTAQTVDDTLLATNDLHITSATSAITLAGTPADADFLGFQISRNPASDTLSGDAKLLGVSIRITTDAAIDA